MNDVIANSLAFVAGVTMFSVICFASSKHEEHQRIKAEKEKRRAIKKAVLDVQAAYERKIMWLEHLHEHELQETADKLKAFQEADTVWKSSIARRRIRF